MGQCLCKDKSKDESEDESKDEKNISDKLEDGASYANKAVQVTSNVMGAAADVVPVLTSFTNFLPLIKEVGVVFDEIIKIVKAAEHNKRTCKILQRRVLAAKLAIQDLEDERDEREDFFNNENFSSLQELSRIIKQIKVFILEISQMKTLLKYIKATSIEETFINLREEFDSCINLVSFSINVKIADELKQLKADELKQLKDDQEDLIKYLEEMMNSIKTVGNDVKGIECETKEIKEHLISFSDQFLSTINKVDTISNTMEKFISKDQVKIDNIFQVRPLKFADYKEEEEQPRKDGRVTKWNSTKYEELAFKVISDNEEKMVQNQVTILKELHDCQNIIKFYGLTCDGNKWYLVTEWAEYGNLREYYTNYKDRFDLRLKLRMSLDIARGLSFLRAVEIVHRDVRAENILITLNETAKLANFNLSRYLTAATANHKQNLERARYCAPELLERAQNFQYNQKCEVYSFGILLWEIAEQRIPYQDSNDILDITEKVLNKRYREPFSDDSQMPEEFKKLVDDAVLYDSDRRPKITKMHKVLRDCVHSKKSPKRTFTDQDKIALPVNSQRKKKPQKRTFTDQDKFALPDYESFKYMTLTDAAKQHNLVDGDVKTAYKCFEAYANFASTAKRNQIMAKYYKAIYISRGLVDSPPNKDKIIAELFKEVADDEANEFPDAKVRYADCLLNGKGVEKNESEALKYFEKAADDDLKVAMYNAGNMHFNGIGCERDIVKAKKYIKLAVMKGYDSAIKFREEHNL